MSANSNATAGTTWGFDMQLVPHPVNFMSALKYDSVTPTGQNMSFMNTQIGGLTDSHYAKYNAFRAQARRWRLAYMSVTAYQDGPDLANQGTLVACQKPVTHAKFDLCAARLDGLGKQTGIDTYQNVITMNADDLPAFDSSQSMPNAYFGKSKEGVYLPLKLTKTCQRWTSREDDIRLSLGAQGNSTIQGTNLLVPEVDTVTYIPAGYPFGDQFNMPGLVVVNNALGATYTRGGAGKSVGEVDGQETSNFLNDVWGDISARNLALSTSFSFFVRCGLEMQVIPGSILSPHQKLSPPHDGLALDTYFAISRELKDAYPADFNDLGKIWDSISSAAKAISPFLNFIPEVGPILSAGVLGVTTAGDVIRQATKGKKAETLSMAQLDKAQKDREVRSMLKSAADTVAARKTSARASYSGKQVKFPEQPGIKGRRRSAAEREAVRRRNSLINLRSYKRPGRQNRQ